MDVEVREGEVRAREGAGEEEVVAEAGAEQEERARLLPVEAHLLEAKSETVFQDRTPRREGVTIARPERARRRFRRALLLPSSVTPS